ncbi:VOC family protein [Rhodovulum sp. DZ06]|uniref:VOC family protein n=1 Tax=Rhodovulum sp. DZ06 TaxID=3425126 RepID=UPI003D353127
MPAPSLSCIDHFVLTVASIDAACAFYRDALGMEVERFAAADGTTRTALRFGAQKINLHQAGAEFDPKALRPTPGSGDFCLVSDAPTGAWQAHFHALGVAIEDGPVKRTGARGPLVSLYVRDPDGNLVEIARPA